MKRKWKRRNKRIGEQNRSGKTWRLRNSELVALNDTKYGKETSGQHKAVTGYKKWAGNYHFYFLFLGQCFAWFLNICCFIVETHSSGDMYVEHQHVQNTFPLVIPLWLQIPLLSPKTSTLVHFFLCCYHHCWTAAQFLHHTTAF